MAKQQVPTAVLAQTKNLRLRESMLLGSGLEGGWNAPFPVGDQGTSFGPYQMHEGGALTSSGLSPQQAENANTATKAMLPAYSGAVNQISDQEWKNNPQQAAEQAAVIAERPANDYYSTDGLSTVNQVWSNTQGVLKGKKSTGGMPPQNANLTSAGGTIVGGLSDFGNPLTGFGGIASILGTIFGASGSSNLKDWLERGGLIIFGGLLVLVGIVIFAAPAARQAVSAASGTAASANRGLSAARNLGGGTGAADAERRQAIAERSNELGERKLALQQQKAQHSQSLREKSLGLAQQRENRLAAADAQQREDRLAAAASKSE